jgi:hypothetical protein
MAMTTEQPETCDQHYGGYVALASIFFAVTSSAFIWILIRPWILRSYTHGQP